MTDSSIHTATPLRAAFFPTLALSALSVLLSFTWQGSKGFNLWDEGFLWYGVQRVLAGETPLLDFMAYDPGRYYWSAALLRAMGDAGSIVGVRASVAAFQWVGLCVGLLLVVQATPLRRRGNFLFWSLACISLIAWMFPRHKLFDIALSMIQLGALALLAGRPQPRVFFLAGLVVGLSAVFGRNHGLYGALGSLGVMAWLRIGPAAPVGPVRAGGAWLVGVVAGYLPVLAMLVAVPGFASAFVESVRLLLEQQGTNLPLPVPWPWQAQFAELPLGQWARQVLIGLFFVGLLVFGGVAVVAVCVRRAMQRPVSPVLVAAAFLALPYAHYAFSRADVGHLAHGIYPLLIGCFALLAAARASLRWPLGLALCASCLWVMHVFHPGWQCRADSACVGVEISGDTVVMDPTVAGDVRLLRDLAQKHAPNGEPFLAAPFWPGAYALLERKAPVWEIYPLFPRPLEFERKEIERIVAAAPTFAFVYDAPLDGREELRFNNTHPTVHRYIVEHFQRLPYPDNPAYQIYTRRTPKP
jgi:hypothetical protein